MQKALIVKIGAFLLELPKYPLVYQFDSLSGLFFYEEKWINTRHKI
jgi:hypothetical protein